MYNGPVPVIMCHSVGMPNKKWNFSYLTCPYKIFESQLKWIKNRGFNTISLNELYEYMSKNTSIPNNPVILTFDDGYSDNWVFAYPLLKKYNMKATIYINPEFTEHRKEKLNLEDVWNNNAKIEDLDTLGYLSWEELKIIEEDGLVDIQSHTMTHTWYPQSDKIIDFRHPQDAYLWMTWNENPEKKPALQIDDQNLINYGQPIYEHGRSIGIKRYIPDKNLNYFLIDHVKDKVTEGFFNSEGWKEELFVIINGYKNENPLEGRFESEEEYEKRIYFELNTSKKVIENELEKEVNFLCWPGGAVTNKALKIASQVGYISSTVGKDLTDSKKYLKNTYGEEYSRINRIGNISYWDAIEGPNSKVRYMNGFDLLLSLYHFQDKFLISKLSLALLYLNTLKYKFLIG